MKVVDWIAWDVAVKLPENVLGGLGGWVKGETIDEYLDQEGFPPVAREYVEAIAREVVANNMRVGGDWHQDNGVPLFDDGTVSTFSYRAWGDLMAAIWNTAEEGAGHGHSYMCFYMGMGGDDSRSCRRGKGDS